MTSRERLIAAMNHQIPDRVPVSTYEIFGWDSSAWFNNVSSYARLMEAIRHRSDSIIMWQPSDNAQFNCITAYPVPAETKEWREGDTKIVRTTYHTPAGDLSSTSKEIDNIVTLWRTERLCKSIEDVDKVLSVPFEPLTYDVADFQRIRRNVGDHGIIMPSIADALCYAAELMEFGDFTVWAMTETEHFARTVQMLHDQVMENLRRLLAANVADLYRIYGPEYASPPFLPPVFFERYVVPQCREMIDLIHQHGAKVRIHCHGRIGQLLDMIVATGADGTDPCEAPPDGDITLAEVKQRAGKRLCLFGNIQLKLLEHGTRSQVREAVKLCMDSAKADGGFVLMPTASPVNIPLDQKTEENYMQFFAAAEEYGEYTK